MRVRRDRILEHLSSGRHYRNRRLLKQHGGQTPTFISAASDLSNHLPIQLDPPPTLLSQPPYVFPGVPCLTNTSASVAPSPLSYPKALLPAHLSAISSTASAVPVREDRTPSTSTSHPSAFTTLRMRSPAGPSQQNNQRLVSEASNSVVSGSGVAWLPSDGALGSSLGLALFGVGHGSKALFQSLVEEDSCCLLYVVENQLSGVEQAFRSDRLVNTRVLREQDADLYLTISGKGVFCEKLPSLDRQIAEMCFDEANRCGKPLVCGFYKRFDPALQFLYQKVRESHALGRIHRIAVVSSLYPAASLSLLRKSGGIFYNAAVHYVDIVSLLLGESVPDTVFSLGHAFCSDVASLKDADSVMISMEFPSGAIVSLYISQHCTRSCDLRAECFPQVHGSQGTLRINNQNPLGITEQGTSVSIYSDTHADRCQEAYRGLFRHFLRTLKGKEPPTVPKEQFLWTLQVAAAAEQSWRNGSSVDLSNEGQDPNAVSVIKMEML
uniref:Uncharacterized protein LOC110197742 n=1 Tax=Phascolarctos cinereus TaxID=38626 RepID=A0A6P5IZC9_PHACI|nr:uncharacterized protein LOC110197742 [Phascolarctos cinereus]